MGLDMYLHRKLYVTTNILSKIDDVSQVPFVKPERIKYITEEMGYWRKFHALDKWFTDSFKESYSEASGYQLDVNDLMDLKDILEFITIGRHIEICEIDQELIDSLDYEYDLDKQMIDHTLKILDEVISEDQLMNTKGDFSTFAKYFYESNY